MKKLSTAVVATLMTVSLCGNVHAEWERAHRPWPNASVHHDRGHGGDWVAPLVFLGLAGAVISAANSQPSAPQVVYSAPATTYVVPEVRYVQPVAPAPAPASALYFCASVGRYYPNTQYCPEGWQLVQR